MPLRTHFPWMHKRDSSAPLHGDWSPCVPDHSLARPEFQYSNISVAEGSLRGRTTRKPRNCASVKYHTLFGNWGSCIFHVLSENRRAALRNWAASASKLPPRTTWGYGLAALFHSTAGTFGSASGD